MFCMSTCLFVFFSLSESHKTRTCMILLVLSNQKNSALIWWTQCIFLHTVHLVQCCIYKRHRINLLCCIPHMQAWQTKFSFRSCVQLPGDGANWTKTVFHCWLTGSCESIYSLTAMRQNGPWKRGASRSLRKFGSVQWALFSLTVHVAYIISVCVCYMWLCRTMSDRRRCTHFNRDQFLWMDAVFPFHPYSDPPRDAV